MKHKWINKSGGKNLIVFFNGWGMDEKIVSHLSCGNNDVIVFFDYQTTDTDFSDFKIFSNYEKKYLIAWSMGVYVCNYFYKEFKNFDKYTAINGTQNPIDDLYGIPKAIYDLTVRNFNELSCAKFMSKITSAVNLRDYCSRNLTELKNELVSIRDLKINDKFVFNKAVIGNKDKIFPVKNQINYWQKQNVNYEIINSGHYIFDNYQNWSDLL